VGDVATMFEASANQTINRLSAQLKRDGYLSPADQADLDAATAQSKLWGEGGEARALLHGATQGVLAWLGGGYSLDAGLRGAGGAILSSYLAPLVAEKVQKLLNDAGFSTANPETPSVLAKLIGQLAITGIGTSLGNAGAVTAASVYTNNYLTHEQLERMQKAMKELYSQLLATDCDRNEGACIALNVQIQQLTKFYDELSANNSAALLAACADQNSEACRGGYNELRGFLDSQDSYFLRYGYSANHFTNNGKDQVLDEVLQKYFSGSLTYQETQS
jgi:hypothetical protein